MSLIDTNRTAQEAAALGARAKDRALDAVAQAVPVGKRAGATAVEGVRQGVQDAREWAAPRLDDAADAVTTTVAPKVSSALHATAEQVRPTAKSGTRWLDWRLLLGAGIALAAAGAGAAIAMRRRYASATEEAKNATESPGEDRAAQDGEAADTAIRSEVNGRVTSPGT